MGKTSIYVREGDSRVWEQAKQLAGGDESLSSIISDCIHGYVTRKEHEAQGFETIQVGPRRFQGRWLAHNEDTDGWRGIALTRRGAFAYCWESGSVNETSHLGVHHDLNQLASEEELDDDDYLLLEAAEQFGDVIEMDI